MRTIQSIRDKWSGGADSDFAEDVRFLLAQLDALLDASKPPPPGLIEVDGVLYGQHTIRMLQSLVNGCIAAGFIDSAMNVRKVLGTLPLTADGYLAGSDAELWWVDNSKYGQMVCVLPTDVSDCYSTREAAEAAREAKP